MKEIEHIPFHFRKYSGKEMGERATSFRDLMEQRRSVRFFSDREVDQKLIETAVLTASSAPSGAHRQPWHFVAVSDVEVKQEIRKAAEKEEYDSYHGRMSEEWLEAIEPLGTVWEKPFLEIAPWLVVCFSESYKIDAEGQKSRNYYVQESCGIACGVFIAALHNMGLATLTHTPSPMRFLNKILKRPVNEKPYILFPVGYPAKNATVPDLKRKELSQISSWFAAKDRS